MLILILATVDKAVLVNLYCGSTINVPPVHVFTVRTVGCTQKFFKIFFGFFSSILWTLLSKKAWKNFENFFADTLTYGLKEFETIWSLICDL